MPKAPPGFIALLCQQKPQSYRKNRSQNKRGWSYLQQSFELMVQALDCLSRTASRYGRRGKKVFEANRHPIVSAIQLFECLPFADAEEEFVRLLKTRLEAMPEFDPEGWALRLVA
jgi:hypothetical protein